MLFLLLSLHCSNSAHSQEMNKFEKMALFFAISKVLYINYTLDKT